MNSLNIVTRLATTPPATPSRPRTSSSSQVETSSQDEKGSRLKPGAPELDPPALSEKLDTPYTERNGLPDAPDAIDGERTPLLGGESEKVAPGQTKGRLWEVPRRVARAILHGAAVVIRAITAPGRFVIACFYDEDGHFSAIMPLENLRSLLSKRNRKSAAVSAAPTTAQEQASASEKSRSPPLRKTSRLRSPSVESTASTTEGETETEKSNDSPARHTRSKTAATANAEQGDDIAPHRKSGRVKLLHNDEALRKRKLARAQQKKAQAANPDDVAAVASSLKSPSSPTVSTKLTRYPRSPAPPRPLVPRRQPSYVLSYSADAPKKTLIIDLDETLIHSMAKGGRMSTGHMVEVRLGGAVSSSGINIGPGVPILYYVHERPGCHEFLRKVSKWYNLVVFTASVQEYADPVVDWLERERRYFSGRYYRQHCTFRNGAYIKDLAQIEPDLSKVMILDNSPMSYIFHEDNAIPIEGWISDPTDNDLLHLIPFLEGLQYVNDVRALLALRQGQAPQA